MNTSQKQKHQFRDRRLPINRAEWTQEHFQIGIAEIRRDAAKLRERANAKDAQAEDLRRESAAMATEKLPLFNPVERNTGDIF